MEKITADLQFHLNIEASFKGQICISAFCELGRLFFFLFFPRKSYEPESYLNCEVPTWQMADNQGLEECRKAVSSFKQCK